MKIKKFEDLNEGSNDIPKGYVSDETLIEKLSNAVALDEWDLVNEVIMDLKHRNIYKDQKNKNQNTPDDDNYGGVMSGHFGRDY